MAEIAAAWAVLEILFALETLLNLALVGGGLWWLLRADRAPAPAADAAAADDALPA